jgi:transcriptional regulator with XRE-family HTH domain
MDSIGSRIFKLRKQRRLTQRELAELAGVSVDLVSKLEQGVKQTARITSLEKIAGALGVPLTGVLCRELGTGADLLTPDDSERLSKAVERPSRVDTEVPASLDVILAEQRRIEDNIGAAPIVGLVDAHMQIISGMVIEARGERRKAVLETAGQWAQFAGWLHTAIEDYTSSDLWFGCSLQWATEAANDDLLATVLSFRGHVAWLKGEVGPVIGISQAARRYKGIYAGQSAYDALQEARGHAILGDSYAVERLVDESNALAEQALIDLPHAPAWHYYRSSAFWDLERGRALVRLPQRRKQATDFLTAGLDALPAEQKHADWVCAYRRDLAAITH